MSWHRLVDMVMQPPVYQCSETIDFVTSGDSRRPFRWRRCRAVASGEDGRGAPVTLIRVAKTADDLTARQRPSPPNSGAFPSLQGPHVAKARKFGAAAAVWAQTAERSRGATTAG